MPLNIVQFCDDPPKISTKSSYPKKYSFFWKPKKILKFKFLNPPKMTRAYVCMKLSEHPPLPPGVLQRLFTLRPTVCLPRDQAYDVKLHWAGVQRKIQVSTCAYRRLISVCVSTQSNPSLCIHRARTPLAPTFFKTSYENEIIWSQLDQIISFS